MKFIIILLLAQDPIYIPFDTTLDCYDQGNETMESIATYHGPGPKQGWYTDHGALLYGFYCE
jgi:hypothetical protein